MVKYIHYGSDHYDPDYYYGTIKNISGFEKPIGGLWASRTDSVFGWKEWCKVEHYDLTDFNLHFEFTIKDNANIVYLESEEDILNQLPLQIDCPFVEIPVISTFKSYNIDFEKCVELGIDAIELLNSAALHYQLSGWDCDCILILNYDIIVPE